MEVRELVTKLGFKVDQTKLKNFESRMKSVRKSMTVVAGVATAFGGAVFYMTKQIADLGDQLAKNSARVGLSIQQLQKYSYSAQLAGADLEIFRNGITRFSRNLVDAKDGVGEAKEAFEKLGIDPKQLTDTNQAFLLIADKFSKMEDGYLKTALAQELFGRSGAQLINMLNEGSEALRKQGMELLALGGVMDDKFARKSEAFNDNLLRIRSFILGLRIAVAKGLIEQFNKFAEKTVEWAKANKELIQTRIKEYTEKLGKAIQWVADNAKKVIAFFGILGAFWLISPILTGLKAIADLFLLLKGAMSLSAAPWILVAGAIGLAALAIEDLHVGLNGGESELFMKNTDDYIKNMKRFGASITAPLHGLQELMAIIEGKNQNPKFLKFLEKLKINPNINHAFLDHFIDTFKNKFKDAIVWAFKEGLMAIFKNFDLPEKTNLKLANVNPMQNIMGSLFKYHIPAQMKNSNPDINQRIEFRPQITVNMPKGSSTEDLSLEIEDQMGRVVRRMLRNTKRDLETAGV